MITERGRIDTRKSMKPTGESLEWWWGGTAPPALLPGHHSEHSIAGNEGEGVQAAYAISNI